MASYSLTLGGDDTASDFKPPRQTGKVKRPIELLTPGSDLHTSVLAYIKERIKTSEDRMRQFYSRWNIAERKMQAYLTLPNYEQILKQMNDNSEPPAPSILIFPYNYATTATSVSHGLKVFCGRKPYFPLGADSAESAQLVHYMQTMVQRHLDMSNGIMRVFQTLLDGEIYGLGVLRCVWKTKWGKRRVVRPPTPAELQFYGASGQPPPPFVRDAERRVVWAGCEFSNIDPYMFFPDPNVPMNEVSEKGEYVFWRDFVGKHILIQAQLQGLLSYVDSVEPMSGSNRDSEWHNISQRTVLTGGAAHAGDRYDTQYGTTQNVYQVDQGSVTIIPKELGLGPEEFPAKYLFTVLNDSQIVQCEELDLDHDRHPIEVSEPHSLGYGFGQPALGDYTGPIQDILSWFITSHIYNVRANLNNEYLYDPSKINEEDMKYPQPGKRIRLRPLAYGTDVREAFTQLQTTDVTRGHMADLGAFLKIGDMVSAINEPMRGVPSSGGRKTATEVRRTDEGSHSRLEEHWRVVSAQCFTRITEQAVLNIQQLQDPDQWIRVIGREAFNSFGAQLLTQDFTYPVSDGTLPLDRVINFEIWKEILEGMAQSPLLMQTHSLPKIFEHVCTLGGAPNITNFRLMPDQQVDEMLKSGNIVPVSALNGAGPSQPPAGQPLQ